MLTALALICGAITLWLVVDHLVVRRDARRAGWERQFGEGRTFQSTGFEDTLPPAAAEVDLRGRRGLAR